MVGAEAGSTGAAAASSERRRCGTGRRDGDVDGSTRERAASHPSGDGGGSTGGGATGVREVGDDIGKADVGGAAWASCAEWREPGAPSSCRAIELQSCGP